MAKGYHRHSSLNSRGGITMSFKQAQNKTKQNKKKTQWVLIKKNVSISITFFIYNKHKLYMLPPDLEQWGGGNITAQFRIFWV